MADSNSFVPPSDVENAAVERLTEGIKAEYETYTGTYRFTSIATLRFLRALKQDEAKALEAMKKHLAWRTEHSVDTIAEHPEKYDVELAKKKVFVHGTDKQGHPVLFVLARKHKGNDRDLNQIRDVIIYQMEELMKAAQPENERIVICFDLEGFSYSCMDNEVVRLLISILQFNYPDTLHKAYIVSSPFIFSTCWVVIRPWLDPVTTSKVAFVYKTDLENDFLPETIEGLNA